MSLPHSGQGLATLPALARLIVGDSWVTAWGFLRELGSYLVIWALAMCLLWLMLTNRHEALLRLADGGHMARAAYTAAARRGNSGPALAPGQSLAVLEGFLVPATALIPEQGHRDPAWAKC